MVTEIQTLFARVIPGKINPLIQSIADVPDSDLEFYWGTVALVANVNEAKRQRTPFQRIVRKATSRYPGAVIDARQRSLHIFENPKVPMVENRAAALARLREKAANLSLEQVSR